MKDGRRAAKAALALAALALGVSARVGVWTETAKAARQEQKEQKEQTVEQILDKYVAAIGWLQSPRGLPSLGGAQLAELKQDANLQADLHLRERYPEMTAEGREKAG